MTQIAVNQEQLRIVLEDLIRIPSVNPSLSNNGQGETQIARYIGDYFKRMGLDVRYQEPKTGRMNVIGILKGSGGGRTLMLNGHMDTVSTERMKIEPFTPVFKDGRIYGRGAFDMKCGLAAQMLAIQSLIESGISLKGDILVTCVADEEHASIGTEAVLQEYTADAAIITEPTDLEIVIAHKGFAWIKVEVFGKAAHGSMPEDGIDAIIKVGKVLEAVEHLGDEVLTRKTHPLLGSPSIHASLIHGGIELSTYPDYCKVEFERRTLPDEDADLVTAEMQKLLQQIASKDPNFQAKSNVFFARQGFEISQEHPLVQTVTQAYRNVMHKEPLYTGTSGWLEAGLLAEAGIPTVMFGPAGDGAHAAVESVDMDSVVTTTHVLCETIMDFCNA